MPTQQEQVAQVEAALKRRFFQFIPKLETPNRANWGEDQHNTDRLSRALAAYALVGISEIDDATAAGAVTDGENDGGIDAVYFDRLRSRLMLVQSKFKRTGAAPSQEEALKTINGTRALVNRQFAIFNANFHRRLDEIEEALDTPGVMLEVVLVFLGENLGPHVTTDMNALEAELNRVNPCLMWHADGLSKIYGWLIFEQTPQSVTVDVSLECWAFTQAPRKAVYGQISAAALAELVSTHGKALFERNIRHYLGSVGLNVAIEETVRRRPGDLFYLNNGITALTESITKAPGTLDKCTFRLTNVSVVNGAQTAGAIANAAIAGAISPDAKLLITIIEIGQNPDDIGLRITRARNLQNVVRAVDFAALDPNQERLRVELAAVGITYHYRPSAEARARRDDAFTLEEAAVALACLSFRVLSSVQVYEQRGKAEKEQNAVDSVVAAKKEIGRLWEQSGSIYGQLFRENLSGLRMSRMVRIFRFIDQILAATEWSESQYYRSTFFRHGRYFIMAFVAHLLPALLNRAELELSEADKTALSQKTNEIAELIYAVSTPSQGVRGYLAIFRNLTDAQPLADAVLIRLAVQNAESVAVVPTPPPNVNPQSP
jgi:hypothetical protein